MIRKEAVLFVAWLVCLALLLVLFPSLLIVFSIICIAAGTALHALVKRKSMSDLIKDVAHVTYSMTGAMLITVLVIIVLPYLVFGDTFVNLFIAQYLYLFPVLFIFFAALPLLYHLLQESVLLIRKPIIEGLVAAFAISIIISALLVIGSVVLVDQQMDKLYWQYDNLLNDVGAVPDIDIQVVAEIRDYREKLIVQIEQQKRTIKAFDPGACLTSRCVEFIGMMTVDVIDKTRQVSILNTLIQKSEGIVLGPVDEAKLAQLIDSLEPPKKFFADQKDILASDFTYAEYQEVLAVVPTDAVGITHIATINPETPLFMRGILYAAQHVKPWQELFRSMVNIIGLMKDSPRRGPLTMQLYENLDVQESPQSKYVRATIIWERFSVAQKSN